VLNIQKRKEREKQAVYNKKMRFPLNIFKVSPLSAISIERFNIGSCRPMVAQLPTFHPPRAGELRSPLGPVHDLISQNPAVALPQKGCNVVNPTK
jgi:hypothetical protein